MEDKQFKLLPYAVQTEKDWKNTSYDALVVVLTDSNSLPDALSSLKDTLANYAKVDTGAYVHAGAKLLMVPTNLYHTGRLILAFTGPINRDIDDSRRFAEAAEAGVKKAIEVGSKQPLLVVPGKQTLQGYEQATLVTILGGLTAIFMPLETRKVVEVKVKNIGVWSPLDYSETERIVKLATALETGRTVAKDISGGHPDSMTPPHVADYVRQVFAVVGGVKVDVIENQEILEKEYPMLYAVNRAQKHTPKYQARLISLSYQGEGKVEDTLMFVGKGVTFDSGGMDVKISGAMLGMHRDKGGSAAVCGFFVVLGLLKPKGLKVEGYMAMVRNGISADAYTCDEVITARSGKRVRIVNTDAEGRLAMLDPLCSMRERAGNEVNPHLFTIATLTGHAVIAVGLAYTIAIDNGPARKELTAQKLQAEGDKIADPFEISTLRREEYKGHFTDTDYEDLWHGPSKPSSQVPRGHQIPMAFMILGSGLDKHGSESEKPIKYTHLDIAGSEGEFPGYPRGTPVLALSMRYIVPRI